MLNRIAVAFKHLVFPSRPGNINLHSVSHDMNVRGYMKNIKERKSFSIKNFYLEIKWLTCSLEEDRRRYQRALSGCYDTNQKTKWILIVNSLLSVWKWILSYKAKERKKERKGLSTNMHVLQLIQNIICTRAINFQKERTEEIQASSFLCVTWKSHKLQGGWSHSRRGLVTKIVGEVGVLEVEGRLCRQNSSFRAAATHRVDHFDVAGQGHSQLWN